MKTYKIRQFANGRSKDGRAYNNYSLTVPGEIAEHIPADLRFTCEASEEGILFRPVTVAEPARPTWAQPTVPAGPQPTGRPSGEFELAAALASLTGAV